MNEICMIIDIDGFTTGKGGNFIPIELGVACLNDNGSLESLNLAHFKPDIDLHSLPLKFQKSIHYCQKYIHGLSYELFYEQELWPPCDHLNNVILYYYNRYKTSQRKTIAYKGGTIEKKVLTNMNIPHVDLEIYGCPKFEELNKNPTFDKLPPCQHHDWVIDIKTQKTKEPHCACNEVYLFYQWMICEDYSDQYAAH